MNTFHALLNGTMWSMSTSLDVVHVAPSYGDSQEPLVDAHAESTTTLVPSRFRTVSRVLQVPEIVIQVGNRSRPASQVRLKAQRTATPV